MADIKVLPRMKEDDIDLSELFSTMDNVKETGQLAQNILANTEGEVFVDKWFPKAEYHLLTAILAYIYEKAPVYEQNTGTIKCFLLSAESHVKSTTAVDMLFDDLEDEDDKDFAVMHYKTFHLYTKPSILYMTYASCMSHIENLTIDDIPWPECMQFQIELKKVSEWYEQNRSFFPSDQFEKRAVDGTSIHTVPEETQEESSDFLTVLNSEFKSESESESEPDFEHSPHRQVAFITDILYLDRETCHAKAIRVAKKIIILKGSVIDKEIKASMPESSRKLRSENARKIDRQGVLKESIFASSASEAAGFVTGMNTNGKIEWRTADGRSLGDLIQAEKDAESIKKGSACVDGQKNVSEDIENETKLEEETEQEAEEQTIAEDFDGLVTPNMSETESPSVELPESDKTDNTHGFGAI